MVRIHASLAAFAVSFLACGPPDVADTPSDLDDGGDTSEGDGDGDGDDVPPNPCERVMQGDFEVLSNADLEELRGVVELDGNLN